MNGPLEPVRVVPAVPSHVEELAPRLREGDRLEIRAAFDRPADEILRTGFRNAKRCWTVLGGRCPVAMFGVGHRREPRVGTVWLLASDDFDGLRSRLKREGPYWVEVLMTGHDVLTNFVRADNRVAVRWLRWLGFELLVLHRGIGRGEEDFWEFAAFRPGARERYLSRAPSSSALPPAAVPDGEAGLPPGERPEARRRKPALD